MAYVSKKRKVAAGLFIVVSLKLSNKLSEKDPVFFLLKRLKEHFGIIWSIPLTKSDIYVLNVRSLN